MTSVIDLGNRAETQKLGLCFRDEFEVAAIARASHHFGDTQLPASRPGFELTYVGWARSVPITFN